MVYNIIKVRWKGGKKPNAEFTLLTVTVNGDWFKSVVQNHQGTSSIKANAFDFDIFNALGHFLSSHMLPY